jgi:hypothetical protein
MILTREQILGAVDLKTEEVDVLEWGGSVLVTGLTGTERDRFEQDSIQGKGKNVTMNFTNMRARLVAMAVVDGDGKRLFAHDDVKALGGKSAAALNRVFEVAQRLSGLTANDLEELTEDFGDGQTGSATSA